MWIKKEQPTPFDQQPPQGLFYLDGDLLAKLMGVPWTRGEKFTMIAFPSEEEFQLWEGVKSPIVHLFGEMDLPLQDTRDNAYRHAQHVASQCGYAVQKIGSQQLEVIGHDTDEHFVITYGDDRIVDIQRPAPEFQRTAPPQDLLPDDIRAKLPPLYSQEHLGLDAVAQVKYFDAGGAWTWYGSEFDGTDLFFGLVDGFELELGLFSLSELKRARDQGSALIERDQYFEPRSLRAIQEEHRQRRGYR